MYLKVKGHIMAIVLVTAGLGAFAQATRSPFTSRGLGDFIDLNLAHNQGNGGLGYSNGTFWNLNNVNPALLPYNSLTVFAAGFVGQSNNVTNGTTSEVYQGGNLNYLITAFPALRGKWTTSVGLMPYSNVSYDFSYSDVVSGSNDIVDIRESGSGGINQLFWSNGWAFNSRFSAGLRATYLFSAVEKEFSNTIRDIGNSYTPVISDRVSISDFTLSGGLAYNIDSIFNTGIKFNAGLVYELGGEMKATRFQSINRTVNGNPPIDADTLINNARGSLSLPQAFGVGISFNKGLNWLVGMDIRMQGWSDFKDFNGNNTAYDDSFKITLGGEFTPDPTSVTSYFKRITYRFGGSFENTPYLIDNNGELNQVRDFGINFGWSLPAGRYSSFDMAFRFGQRGNASTTIIEENYFKVYMGITFNDQWFIKRKYD